MPGEVARPPLSLSTLPCPGIAALPLLMSKDTSSVDIVIKKILFPNYNILLIFAFSVDMMQTKRF